MLLVIEISSVLLSMAAFRWRPVRQGKDGDGTEEVRSEAADGPPQAFSVMAHSRSVTSNSPHYRDQTKLFSAGKWVTGRFTEDQLAASPELQIKVLN
ncbi:penicillin acylase family protein [Streptomyces sp. NPDC059092]|uniref:penicillin acylase family protein n=1 Tax=Streptomyces sp. NPDC059092 TaxID=3346725 RepID=UPI0036BA0A4F